MPVKNDVFFAAIVVAIAIAAAIAAMPVGNSATTVVPDWTNSVLAFIFSTLMVNDPLDVNVTSCEEIPSGGILKAKRIENCKFSLYRGDKTLLPNNHYWAVSSL